MTQYEHSLISMKRLLDAVRESHWAQWIERDIRDWRANRDTTHHLSAYGGMGSFNDVWICRANSHAVTHAQEPWANALFEWLKSLCHFLANNASDNFTAGQLSREIGRHNPSLAAFVGGDRAPASMRGYVTEGRKLQGWRCLRCGESEVSRSDIENMLAQDLIPHTVFDSCEHFTLERLVDETLALGVPSLQAVRESLVSAVAYSGIEIRDRDGWMRPCRKCGEDETAVYRWKLVVDSRWRFEPSDDNLAMRR